MSDREKELSEATERAKSRLVQEAAQYVGGAEPLVVMQYIFFRSLIQEAHLYALIDQLQTGKIELAELQKRFIDHANRIAGELSARRSTGGIVKPVKLQ